MVYSNYLIWSLLNYNRLSIKRFFFLRSSIFTLRNTQKIFLTNAIIHVVGLFSFPKFTNWWSFDVFWGPTAIIVFKTWRYWTLSLPESIIIWRIAILFERRHFKHWRHILFGSLHVDIVVTFVWHFFHGIPSWFLWPYIHHCFHFATLTFPLFELDWLGRFILFHVVVWFDWNLLCCVLNVAGTAVSLWLHPVIFRLHSLAVPFFFLLASVFLGDDVVMLKSILNNFDLKLSKRWWPMTHQPFVLLRFRAWPFKYLKDGGPLVCKWIAH